MIDEMNNTGSLVGTKVNLFTLDVEKLYPSIQPNLAMSAIEDVLNSNTVVERWIKVAIQAFVKLSLDESYVAYKGEVFKPKIGIPTGGSFSR